MLIDILSLIFLLCMAIYIAFALNANDEMEGYYRLKELEGNCCWKEVDIKNLNKPKTEDETQKLST